MCLLNFIKLTFGLFKKFQELILFWILKSGYNQTHLVSVLERQRVKYTQYYEKTLQYTLRYILGVNISLP